MAGNQVLSRVSLRPMTMEDIEQVVALDHASFPTPWPKDAFHYELKHNLNSICWVAEFTQPDIKRFLIGSIIIWLILDEAHIATLAVKPGYRRKKIGQILLAQTLLMCHQRGARQALLEVRETNLAAQNLYYKFGFKVVGLRHDYYKDTHEDALLMTLAPLEKEKLAHLAEGG